MSDLFLVEARLKLVDSWSSAERMEGVRNVLKVNELNHSVKERAYQESLHGKYEVWRDGEVKSVEKEWEKFRDIVMECNNDVCGMRHVSRQRRKGSEFWNEEVGRTVAKKRKNFSGMASEKRGLPMTDTGKLPVQVAVKLQVQAANRILDQRWGERLWSDFEGNKKMF